MQVHPYAALFPMMSDAERAGLLESIRADGLLHPIMCLDGQILDGRNRYSVCEELGMVPQFEEYKGHDPLRYVLATNGQRRQLEDSQRAMVAARLANMKAHENQHTKEVVQSCTTCISLEDAAKMLRVSRRSAATARKIINEAPEDIIVSVDSGALSLNAALKKIQPKPQVEVDNDNSRAIQQMAIDAGMSWAAKGDVISKAVREVTGEKCLRKIDMDDASTRGKVEKVVSDLAGRSLDEQYQAHRTEVATLNETAKQKLERLVARELELRNAVMDNEVREEAQRRLPELAESMRATKARADAEFQKYAAMRHGIKAQISEEDYRFLLQVLHPDRAPEDRRDKFARAFDIVRKLDSYIEAVKA